MKIFNWMRRRFSDPKDVSEENVKQDDQIFGITHENDSCRQSLLNDVEFDGWKGGLLTIGTFGLDPLKHYLNQAKECPNQYHLVEDIEGKEDEPVPEIDDDDDDDDDEENDDNDDDEEEEKEGRGAQVGEYVTSINDFSDDQTAALIKITKMDGDGDAKDHSDDKIVVEKKERITLADLFSAESAQMMEKQPCSFSQEINPKLLRKNPTATPPPKAILKKKLNPNSVKQISLPIQKLMKKMLKRKIHPDVEGKFKSCAGVASTKTVLGAYDSLSLLQTPGITSEVGA